MKDKTTIEILKELSKLITEKPDRDYKYDGLSDDEMYLQDVNLAARNAFKLGLRLGAEIFGD